LVEAANCDVDVAEVAGENNWLKLMIPEVAEAQLGIPARVVMVPPEQKMRDSGIVPVRTIWVAVLAATTPVSIALPVALLATNVEIRA